MADQAMEPLAIWPWPAPAEQLQVVREAFIKLALPFPVQPCPAVPGGPVRVLALGTLPPFICDSALMADPMNADFMVNALRWVLDSEQDLGRGHTVLDHLRLILGDEVREVENDGSEAFSVGAGSKSKVAFR